MIKIIEKYIKNSLSFYQGVKILNKAEYPKYEKIEFTFVAEGIITLKGQSVTVQIALDNHFPLHKPLFFLKPFDALGFIPHVDNSGSICYVHDEGLIIDSTNVTAIIKEAFERVIKTLYDGIIGSNHQDILTEFEAYWNNLENIFLIESNVELTNWVKVIRVAEFENYHWYFAGDSNSDIMNYCYKYIGKTHMGRPTFVDAIYIPLREGTNIIPPNYGTFWTMSHIRQLIYKNVTNSNKRAIERIAKYKVRNNTVLIILISIPLANGHKTLFGVKYSKFTVIDRKRSGWRKEFLHPLYKTDCNCELVPVSISRHDKGYILPRGGGINQLNSKKVALIGCGSVGGHVAIELAKAGVQNLTLIDQDSLMQENVYRHVLGVNRLKSENYKDNKEFKEIVSAKVIGLKQEIEQKLPYSNVQVNSDFTDKIENIILSKKIDFKQYDLVISAIGNPTIELYLNEFIHGIQDMPPILFTWLEAYGIGGHAVLTNNNGKHGCLKCLYIDPFDRHKPLYSRASFAAEGQFFAKQISGCGSVYMPYGSLDSVQTAVIATRLAIDVLCGREKDNPVLSWKGNADLFLESGYKLSEHYSLSSEKLYNARYLYKNDSCQICGHLKDV